MKRLAVLGHPVSHSRSPAMQNAALEALGLGGEWSYEAIDVEPAEFDERVRALPGEGFVGANVTIPHKEAALQRRGRGLRGRAGDRRGQHPELPRGGHPGRQHRRHADCSPPFRNRSRGRPALVLGAGGSARAAVWALAGQGASVSVWNRTSERAEELVRDLAGRGRASRGRSGDEQARAGGFGLIVNCTAIGMKDEDPFERLPLDPDRLECRRRVVDLVYAGSESRLVLEARARGAAAIDGLEVLVRQGAESLRIWTGMDAPLDVMREAAKRGGETDG